MRDLEGQMTLLPEERPERARPAGRAAAAEGLLATGKRTVTVRECALTLGVTTDHVHHLIQDGTLLAVDVSRAGDARRHRRVAAALERDPPADGRLLTVREFLAARSSENGTE